VRRTVPLDQTLTVERPSSAARDWHSVARCLDSTLLKPETTRDQVVALCEEAARFEMATVFVHPSYIALAHEILRGTLTNLGTPVGFPLGAALTTTKRFEAAEAMRLGAQELDIVMNIGALKSGDRRLVELDIRGVVEIAHAGGAVLKVILETPLLSLDEKIIACELSIQAGADFVKTCTGFAGGGATVDDILLMRGVVGERARIKAAGGIRTAADAIRMLEAGADRIGTSAAAQILRELGAA
jgi:deoxyribose-phosphate aldolase